MHVCEAPESNLTDAAATNLYRIITIVRCQNTKVSVFPPIHAYDQDEGIDAKIRYSITASTNSHGEHDLGLGRCGGVVGSLRNCLLKRQFGSTSRRLWVYVTLSALFCPLVI